MTELYDVFTKKHYRDAFNTSKNEDGKPLNFEFNDVIIDKSDAAGILNRHKQRCEQTFNNDNSKKDKKWRKRGIWGAAAYACFELGATGSDQFAIINNPYVQLATRYLYGRAASNILRRVGKPGISKKAKTPDFVGDVTVTRREVINAVEKENNRWIKKARNFNTKHTVVAGLKIAGGVAMIATGNLLGGVGLAVSSFRDLRKIKKLDDFKINASDIGARNEEMKITALQAKYKANENRPSP